MRAIILGAGVSGLLHALSLRAHGVAIEAVFDPDLARARSLSELVGGSVMPSATACVDSNASVVVVSSPPHLHAEQVASYARSDRLIFLEKPVALGRAEFDQLPTVGRIVPVLQWRMGRGLRAVRRAIGEGELGAAPTVSVDLAWSRDREYFERTKSWRCGALLSVGIHAIDAVLVALRGAPLEVSGRLIEADRSAPAAVDRGAVMWMTTEGGASVALRLTLDASHDRTRISFAGGGVTATIEGTENDPTASDVRWSARDDATLRRLHALEAAEFGYVAPPLLVPFVGLALGVVPRGAARIGGTETVIPTLADVAAAHRAVYDVYQQAAARGRDAVAGRLRYG